MKQRPRIYYTESQKVLMWERWKSGQCASDIARVSERTKGAIHHVLAFNIRQGRWTIPAGHDLAISFESLRRARLPGCCCRADCSAD